MVILPIYSLLPSE